MQTVSEKQIESVGETMATVESLTERYMALWNAHAIAKHSQLLTEDADLVNVIGMHVRGRQAIQEHHEHLHKTLFAQSVSRILDLIVHVVDNATVLVHMHWEMKGAAKLPGWNIPDIRSGVMTLLWVKQAEWRVRALHNTDKIPVPELPIP